MDGGQAGTTATTVAEEQDEQKKIQELGNKIGEANSRSLAIKEERIGQLEQRLEEMRNENKSLKESIKKNEQ